MLATLVIVDASGTPAFAKSRNSAAQPSSLGFASAQESTQEHGGAARSTVINACNAEATKWRYSDWQTAQITVYRNCMTDHGQPFE